MGDLLSAGFFRGMLCMAFLSLAWQDYLGVEAYIANVRAHWLQLPHWMAFVWLLCAVAVIAQQAYRVNEFNRSCKRG